MSETRSLDFSTLQKAVVGDAAAFRCVTDLQPAGGQADKVFPPTYEGGEYATEDRKIDGQCVKCVILDSVASQANRVELALLDAVRRGEIELPIIDADFSEHFPDIQKISSLEAPHRIADAIFRDTLMPDGKTRFRDSPDGKSCLTDASLANATSLFGICPTALVFGMWDSTGPKGGGGAKFPRAIVSEIVGIDVIVGCKTESRIDPLQIQKNSGLLYEAKDGGWTLDPAKAKLDKSGKPVKLGKEGRPSDANHGNITPKWTKKGGGVTLARALQTTTLSLPALRRLRFPVAGKKGPEQEKTNDAARTALAALVLCGAVLAQARGLDLRSRCLLVATKAPHWECLGAPGADPATFTLTAKEATELLKQAVAAAVAAGLPWKKEGLALKPLADVVALVKKSRELAAASGSEGS
jgi:CRISPR-associated protein Csb1